MKILACILLLIIGFFFTPAWFVLAGYAIYIFASRKSRRDDAVENRVKKMVAAGQNIAVFTDLYFEAARSYAIAKGARAADQDGASATMVIGGRPYFVVFSRAAGGGTAISTTDSLSVEKELDSFAQATINRLRQ
ncbi:hypothetical protein U8P73_35900 (plasmid) [Rhizobium beringeri]|uniref:hypothetical protein n=1 Tax=Rhizobium beringeri TaxID=3019934 RepID=UPI002DDD32FE|nr:hypothetical protein [Rhizobium beringeri]WSG93535.1 hypothetical protein U8P73_35900 [Rhizobium beringeri]